MSNLLNTIDLDTALTNDAAITSAITLYLRTYISSDKMVEILEELGVSDKDILDLLNNI